jgi:hypothetical protein
MVNNKHDINFFNLFNEEILEDDLKVSEKKLNLLYLKKSTR